MGTARIRLNQGKTCVFNKCGEVPAGTQVLPTVAERVDLEARVRRGDPQSDSVGTILGSPVGTREFVLDELESKAGEHDMPRSQGESNPLPFRICSVHGSFCCIAVLRERTFSEESSALICPTLSPPSNNNQISASALWWVWCALVFARICDLSSGSRQMASAVWSI